MKSNMEEFNKMKQDKILHPKNFLEVDYDSWMKNVTEETPAILRFLGIVGRTEKTKISKLT